jgi:hypothetical protein
MKEALPRKIVFAKQKDKYIGRVLSAEGCISTGIPEYKRAKNSFYTDDAGHCRGYSCGSRNNVH